MSIVYQSPQVVVHHGDCIEVMKTLPDASVDSIVTDPPYGLGFMGRAWDALPPGADFAAEALRVLKPGGHLLAFGGTRTWHRLAVAVEDAGFEIRDSIAWLYGSGFPKSMDVSKALDIAAGAERVKVPASGSLHKNARLNDDGWAKVGAANPLMDGPDPVTDAARQWRGWGTALKPAFEPVVVARKPIQGTVAQNVLKYGTGALNIDASRIGMSDADREAARVPKAEWSSSGTTGATHKRTGDVFEPAAGGRFPANVILDESQAAELDKQSGILKSGANPTSRNSDKFRNAYGEFKGQRDIEPARGADAGGASRFFYTAKASASERPVANGIAHPTVKPLDLMRWLVRLVTPTGGTVLEPFAGSGTTLEAAVLEGFTAIGIEREADYLPLIEQRLDKPHAVGLDIFGGAA